MTIECPSCGSLDCGALYPEYSGICITSDMMVLRDATISNRLCRGCGLIFNSGGTRGSTKSFYQNSYSLMMQAPNAAIQSFAGPRPISQAERSFQLLREMAPLPEAGRVLEAGAGKGEFLDHLTAAMPGWKVCAFEPSIAFEVLKERLPQAEVWHCDYQDAAVSDNSLDLVVALGVLEHVENPLDMLRWGGRLLRPGGIFFLRVPNFANNPNDLFCADHLSKLTAASLRNMAQAAGFEVVGEKEAGVPIFISLRRSGTPAALGNVVRETASIVERNAESARHSMDAVLRARDAARRSGTNMAIFGLGSSGLFAPMFGGFDPNEITAYIDENNSVWGSRIHDRPVGGLDLISQLSIKHIALAISQSISPKCARSSRRSGLRFIQHEPRTRKGLSMQLAAPHFDEVELKLLRRCLESGWVTQGPLTLEFERSIAARHQVKHALATTSCTAALHLATMALGLEPGDEVVVPAFTWVTSAHAAEYVGAKAVLADIEEDTYNLSPQALEAAITPQTRAIVAVHLFGLAADMNAILTIARRRGLAVIEDAACAIGTTYRGQPVGGLGDLGCFSFHPRKVVTTGEGGMVTTNRDDLAAAVQSLRNHGSTGLPSAEIEPHGPWTMATFDRLGYNLRLSDIQAAVGIAQMEKLDRLLAERRLLADGYRERLADVAEIALPTASGKAEGHSYQSYVVRLRLGGRARRNQIMAQLTGRNIQTRPGTHAVHRLGYYRNKYGLRPEQFPIAASCEDTTITLPIFPNMGDSDQDQVTQAIIEALTATRS